MSDPLGDASGNPTGQGQQARPGDESPRSSGTLEFEHPARRLRLHMRTLSRRRFLVITAVSGGVAGASLLFGFKLLGPQHAAKIPPAPAFAPNVWLRITADNIVTITIARTEVGQGVLTSLAMLVAEELDADWRLVRAEQAPPGQQYGNQRTTGSASIAQSFITMRRAGSQARSLLVAAAAQIWGVDSASCRTEGSAVLHPPSGRRLTYGQLITAAAAQRFELGDLKRPSQFRLIGTRAPRLDAAAKVDGSAHFGLDVRLPELLYATVARCPVPGGTIAQFDVAPAQAVPGVRQVVQIPSGVAVIAEHTWAAIAGQHALAVTWDEGAHAGLTSAAIHQQLALKAPQPEAVPGAHHVVSAVYETPYQTHAPMEPLNCTVRLQNDHCEVWAGTQDPQGAQLAAAQASGLPAERVSIHIPSVGGAFGARAGTAFISEAVQVAKAVGKPVQVVWTRENDLQNGFYRPAAYHRMQATLDAAGGLQSWQHGVAAQSMGSGAASGAELPYAVPSLHTSGVNVSGLGVPVTIWRGAEYSYNTFAIESFIDEIAVAAGADPYRFRRGLLDAQPRLQAVLDLAANKAGWGSPMPPRQGRGIAVCLYENANTFLAEVVEASVAEDGTVRVQRVVCGVDCGLVINPAIAEAQIEGSIVQGLSTALNAEITFAHGRVQQSNFHDYPLLRLNAMPKVEVYFVASSENPSGLGEPALPPLAPALANAIFAATGQRIRRLPIRPADLRTA